VLTERTTGEQPKHLKIGIEFDDTHRLFGVPRSGLGFDPDILGAIFFEQKRIVIDESLDPDENPAKEGRYRYTAAHEVGHWRLHRQLFGKDPALHVVRPLFVDQDYILLFLESPHFIETGIPKMTGTAGQKRVPTEYFAHSPFPLPPLAEQHRIVAKVDALMALCDRLEASLTASTATRRRLADALLAEALAPAEDRDTFDSASPDAKPVPTFAGDASEAAE
jgi:hypothetical protein